MPRLRDLTSLLDDVRKRADIENATDRFPDPELTEYVNQSIARLYAMLDRADSTYYVASTTVTTANGTQAYELPADFWLLKGVTVAVDGSTKVRARKHGANMQPWLDNMGAWSPGHPVWYRLKGATPGSQRDRLSFSPIPSGVYTVTVDYTPAPQRLVNGSDIFNGIAGYEEWVILDAAIKTKQKDSLDPSLLLQAKAEAESAILSYGERDVGEPEQIQDVQSVELYCWPWTS